MVSKKAIFSALVAVAAIFFYGVVSSADYQSPLCALFSIQCNSVQIDGTTSEKYKYMRDVYQRMLENGDDLTSCVTIYEKGEKVVDLCAGSANDKPYREALQNVASSTKTVVAIAVAMLVDRNLLEYDAPISKYWPEFATGGKENVTISDLLRHSAGVAVLDNKIPFQILRNNDLDALAKILANQTHNYNSIPTTEYHGVPWGFFVNEIVRRVDPMHRSVREFVAQEIAKPLNAEIYLGVPEELDSRVSPFINYPILKMLLTVLPRVLFNIPFVKPLPDREAFKNILFNPESRFRKMMDIIEGAPDGGKSVSDHVEFRRCYALVSGNAYTNAPTLAAIANEMVTSNPKLFNNKHTRDVANTVHSTQFDHLVLQNFTRTIGGFASMIPGENLLGWAGAGGSLIAWNVEKQIAFAYVPRARGLSLVSDKRAQYLYKSFVNQKPLY